MLWKTIENAPKDTYILGYSAELKKPFVVIWNVIERAFLANQDADGDDLRLSHFMPLPKLPPANLKGWLPLEQGPQSGYCLGYDECLNQPFVMSWNARLHAYELDGGMDDEVPSLCYPLPSLAEAFVSIETLHSAEVAWYWSDKRLHDINHHIEVWNAVDAKVRELALQYKVEINTDYRTQFEGRQFLSNSKEPVEQAALDLAEFLANLDGVAPLPC